MKNKLDKILLILFLSILSKVNAQEEINKIVVFDSLLEMSYDELGYKYREDLKAEKKDHSLLYINAYLQKAKIDYDTLNMARGYHYMSSHFYNDISFDYNDSIIQLTKEKNFKSYPIIAYLINGDLYFERKNFQNSFDSYIAAKSYIKNNKGDEDFEYYINHQIGAIKSKLFLNEEALKTFKESWKFVNDNDYKKRDLREYIQALTDLSISYVQNRKLDSATILNKIGIKESLNSQNYEKYNLLVLNEGINLYFQGKNVQSLDSLKKSIKYFETKISYSPLLYGYYYLGKIYEEESDIENTLKYFKKIDTIFQKINYIDPQVRESYEVLINYYKSIDDNKNILVYIEKLMKVDSVLNNNFEHLTPRIIKEYDTPLLLNEKEKIIKQLKNRESFSTRIIFFLIGLVLIVISALIFYYQKQKTYKKRFEALLKKDVLNDKNYSSTNNEIEFRISDEITQNILQQLNDFEKNKCYLKPDITTSNLAQKFNTNSKYISKVVNTYKGKSFTNYINECRVNYAIERLKLDTIFRKYTIKAIAGEVGFNSAESFSSAFVKKAGISPSYFLKELEKKSNESCI